MKCICNICKTGGVCLDHHRKTEAKAELFDELIAWSKSTDVKEYVQGETSLELCELVLSLLAKAKELSK